MDVNEPGLVFAVRIQLVISVLKRACCLRKCRICGTCDGSVNGILFIRTPCRMDNCHELLLLVII